ncbi:MAG: fibronectin type III-like domain-contianing protein, partial [Paludibacteraceae bacterium]|nr:fibronectin type III-like domain-contianing protein [Paludibacteraceae bacterium]
EANTPLYPFGYGLSYTTFEYLEQGIRTKEQGHSMVSCVVKNTGEMAGAEVVQLYVCAQNSTLARPVKELRGFKRVYLEPGEETTVTFDINEEAVGYYTDLQHFVVEKGLYDIYINSTLVGTIEKN